MAAALSSIIALRLPIRSLRMPSPEQNRRQQLEKAAKIHHQVVQSEPVRFTYRPTPPSGPPPQPQPRPERPQRARED